MTFGELRFQLSKLAPGLDPDTLDGFINDRYQAILDHYKWKGIETDGAITTVAGQAVYDLPADFKLPFDARNPATATEIQFISTAELNRLAPVRDAQGEPQVYTLTSGTEAELYPVPAAVGTYPFRYYRQVARFGPDDTALEIFPWVSIECLKAGVRAEILALEKDYAGADRMEVKFQTEREKMARNDAARKGPQKIRLAPQYTVSHGRSLYRQRQSQMP